MEEENMKKYLAVMHKIIKSANPKYMSYVSREYMKYSSNSPVISEAIKSIITTEVKKNEQSPYAIFLDSDGTIDLEAMSDISRITNLSQFIDQVQKLSKYKIDFSNMSAEDLIKEGDQIASQIEQELEADINQAEMTESGAKDIEEKTSTKLVKLGALAAIGGAIGKSITSVIERIKSRITNFKSTVSEKKELEEKIEDSGKPDVKNQDIGNNFDSVCPKVDVNEQEVLRKMEEDKTKGQNPQRMTDTYGDGDPDGDDINL